MQYHNRPGKLKQDYMRAMLARGAVSIVEIPEADRAEDEYSASSQLSLISLIDNIKLDQSFQARDVTQLEFKHRQKKSHSSNKHLREPKKLRLEHIDGSNFCANKHAKEYIALTVTIIRSHAMQIEEELQEGVKLPNAKGPVNSMTTKVKLVAKPASCESQCISIDYQNSDGQWQTKEVVRSYTTRPPLKNQNQTAPMAQSDELDQIEEMKEIPVMIVNSNENLLK